MQGKATVIRCLFFVTVIGWSAGACNRVVCGPTKLRRVDFQTGRPDRSGLKGWKATAVSGHAGLDRPGRSARAWHTARSSPKAPRRPLSSPLCHPLPALLFPLPLRPRCLLTTNDRSSPAHTGRNAHTARHGQGCSRCLPLLTVPGAAAATLPTTTLHDYHSYTSTLPSTLHPLLHTSTTTRYRHALGPTLHPHRAAVDRQLRLGA